MAMWLKLKGGTCINLDQAKEISAKGLSVTVVMSYDPEVKHVIRTQDPKEFLENLFTEMDGLNPVDAERL